MLHCFASLLHRCQHYIDSCRNRQKTEQDFSTHKCISKDDKVFQLCCGNIGNVQMFVENANENHRFMASMRT